MFSVIVDGVLAMTSRLSPDNSPTKKIPVLLQDFNEVQMSAPLGESDAEEDSRKLKVQIKEKDLLCINGCGFYGTPQWGNRCSKCWRAHQILEKRNQDFAKNQTLLSFDNFQERRKLTTESRSQTIKRLFKSPSLIGSSSNDSIAQQTIHSPPTPPVQRQRALSPESRAARESLTDFLVTHLPSVVVNEVTRQTKHAVNKIHELTRVAPDDLSELVQQFYQYLTDRLEKSAYFTTHNKTNLRPQDVIEEVEKYICVCCYDQLFCASSDEEVADLSLQDRIRSLHWVTAGFLETKIEFGKQEVRDLLDDAVFEMIDINSRRRADEKLSCLIRCSHKIFEALRESGAPTSADEFLPVLIYVLLKGNPPLIQSNVKFISRFALPSRVMSGESGYFFTNLSCAMQFVQDMNHDSLKMEKHEFEAYTSGDLVPPLNTMNCDCTQAIGSMEKSLAKVRALIEKQKEMSIKIDQLEERVNIEEALMQAEFEKTVALFGSDRFKATKEEVLKKEEELSNFKSLMRSNESSHEQSKDVEAVIN